MKFIVNIAKGTVPREVARRWKHSRRPGSAPTPPPRRTIHRPDCRYAGLSRRSYVLDAPAVDRLLLRDRVGNGDGLTRACRHCNAAAAIVGTMDAT